MRNRYFCVIILYVLFFTSCDQPFKDNTPDNTVDNPHKITILGYENSTDNAMEPFITRDGQYLLFNTDTSVGNKDIYIASYVNETTFELIGELGNVNTAQVDGTPTMDSSGNFYFISTVNYDNSTVFDTIFTGTFDPVAHEIDGVSCVDDLAEESAYHVIFDVEINTAGDTMYVASGVYSPSWGAPIEANIKFATKTGSDFILDDNIDVIMQNINSADLEYAPCISSNGLELIFTRADTAMNISMLHATRENTNAPFDAPEILSEINGFVEAPCLSPDEKYLYYHKREHDRFVIYRYKRPL